MIFDYYPFGIIYGWGFVSHVMLHAYIQYRMLKHIFSTYISTQYSLRDVSPYRTKIEAKVDDFDDSRKPFAVKHRKRWLKLSL